MIFSGGTRKNARTAPQSMRTRKPTYVPSLTDPLSGVSQLVAKFRRLEKYAYW